MTQAQPERLAGEIPSATEFTAAAARVFELVEVGRLCAQLWRDIADCKERRCEVAYAIDTDIFKMFTNPSEHARYGHLFQGAPDAHPETADLIGDFILRRWPGILTWSDDIAAQPEAPRLSPLLMLEPHDSELLDIESALRDAATASAGNHSLLRSGAASRKYWSELEQVLARVPEEERAALLFRQLVKDEILPDPCRTPTAAEELSRLKTADKSRIVSQHHHPWFAEGQGGVPAAAPRDGAARQTFAAELAEAAARWEMALKEKYPSTAQRAEQAEAEAGAPVRSRLYRRLQRIRTDAEVLARLELINRRHAEEAAALPRLSRPRRLVLITGTPALLEAARDRKLSFHANFDDFGQAYLRDPRAMLAAPDTLADPKVTDRTATFGWKKTEIRIADLLSRWFPERCKHDEFDKIDGQDTLPGISRRITFSTPTPEEVRLAVEVTQVVEPSLLDELANLPAQWNELSRRLCDLLALRRLDEREAAFADRINQTLVHVPDAAASDDDSGVGALVKVARIQVLESIRSLHLQADWLGVVPLLESGIKIRGLPALRLDCLTETGQKSFESFCAALFSNDGMNRPGRERLQQLYAEFRGHDLSDYHADLLLAFVFAIAGKWPQVRVQCYLAMLGIELSRLRGRLPDRASGLPVDGREASYLLAVAERRLLHGERGLEQARAALSEAMSSPSAVAQPADLRFDSESLAQFVAETQIAQRGRIRRDQFDSSLARALVLVEQARQELNHPVRRWVVRQAVTNGLLLAIFALELQMLPVPQLEAQSRVLVKALHDEGLAPDLENRGLQLYPDGVSDFVWLVTTVLFVSAASDQSRETAREWIRQKYLDLDTLPFASSLERNRHRRLLKLAGFSIHAPEAAAAQPAT